MHGKDDPFKHSASPNRFSLTFPLVNDERISSLSPTLNPNHPTFLSALRHAVALREAIPSLQHSPIFACTDLIHEKPWKGKAEVQLVSPPIARRKAAEIPNRKAA
jgi:hypothetical protein